MLWPGKLRHATTHIQRVQSTQLGCLQKLHVRASAKSRHPPWTCTQTTVSDLTHTPETNQRGQLQSLETTQLFLSLQSPPPLQLISSFDRRRTLHYARSQSKISAYPDRELAVEGGIEDQTSPRSRKELPKEKAAQALHLQGLWGSGGSFPPPAGGESLEGFRGTSAEDTVDGEEELDDDDDDDHHDDDHDGGGPKRRA